MSYSDGEAATPARLPRELDFVRKLSQPAVRREVAELVREGQSTGPLVVEFDPTTACNFSCPECISIGLLNRGQIGKDRVNELIDEFHASGVKAIIFIGGGEPLAHSSMPRPITHAYGLGLAVGLTTNGSLIDRHLDAVAECVDWTRFSVDAGTAGTFAAFRPSHIRNSFDKVISNIALLAKVRRGKIGYSFLLLERLEAGRLLTNCHELLEAAKLAEAIGCDYFEFKPSVDLHHNLIPFSDETRAALAEQLEALRGLESETFRVIYPKSIDHLLASASPDQPKAYTSCPTLELRTVVTPMGIYPCPYKRGDARHRLGGIEPRFDTFWRSPERADRAGRVNPSVDCPFYCIRHEVNLFLHELRGAHGEGREVFSGMVSAGGDTDLFV